MSERANGLQGGEDFREYMKKRNIVESVSNTVFGLYLLEARPADPLDYIRTHMTGTVAEREQLGALTAEHDRAVARVREMQDENMELAKRTKILHDYWENLNG